MKLLFLGDFFYDYDYYASDVKKIAEWIKEHDYKTVINLEGPITDNISKIKKRGEHLKQGRLSLDILKSWNVIGVCLANNHIMDYGEEGLKDTIRILQDNNIQYLGAGLNLDEAIKPLEFNDEGRKIILFNYAWNVEEAVYAKKKRAGCAPKREKLILGQIKQSRLKNPTSKIICVLHWGFEYNLLPMPIDIDLAHKIADSGADFIIGGHPHNIQPIEKYKQSFICYSLGNAYFSSFRKEFSNVRFADVIKNACDYGLGIGICNKEIEFVQFKYDLKEDFQNISVVDENQIQNLNQYNINDRKYCRLCSQKATNYNPILTSNKILAIIKIVVLFGFYKLYRVVRRFLNNKIGNKLKAIIKNC